MQLGVYLARISAGRCKEMGDLLYTNAAGNRREDGDNHGHTRFLSFVANPRGIFPQMVKVAGKTQSDSVEFAREELYSRAAANKGCDACVGFIADAAFASELVQLELIGRIASLFFLKWEELAAIPWAYFEMLAVEMTQKGVVLLRRDWCSQTVFDKRLAGLFEEVAECLHSKRPALFLKGIAQ